MNAAVMKAEINAAPKGCKDAIVNKYADLLKVSRDTIYRMIRREYGPAKIIKREKKIDQKIIDEVAKFKLMGMKLGLKARELSTELCINHVEGTGLKVEGSISTINRRLAESGFRVRKSIVRVEAEYSNQMHQMDFSRSEYFQIWKYDLQRRDWILRVAKQGQIYKNKEDGKKKASWLVGITDAYSRIYKVKMYAASGESSGIGLDFLNEVYLRPEDDHPLRYLCDIFKTDNGACSKDADFKEMLRIYEMRGEFSIPNEKRGIQKQESVWKRIWRRFELDLAIRLGGAGKTICMEDYNELLDIQALKDLEADHPLRNGSRVHDYLSGLPLHMQRIADGDLLASAMRPYERVVRDDLTISIDKEKLECPLFTNGKCIRAWKNRNNEWVGELIDEYHKPFVLKPTQGFVMVGDFSHREEQGYVGKMETEMKRSKEKGVRSRERETIKYIPPREERFEPDTKFTQATDENVIEFSSDYEAKKYIQSRLMRGETYAQYASLFDDILSKSLMREHIDKMIGAIYQSNVRTG